jgi:hypothetical protein
MGRKIWNPDEAHGRVSIYGKTLSLKEGTCANNCQSPSCFRLLPSATRI